MTESGVLSHYHSSAYKPARRLNHCALYDILLPREWALVGGAALFAGVFGLLLFQLLMRVDSPLVAVVVGLSGYGILLLLGAVVARRIARTAAYRFYMLKLEREAAREKDLTAPQVQPFEYRSQLDDSGALKAEVEGEMACGQAL